MAAFKDAAQVQELFGELWTTMIRETDFGSKLREGGISILFEIREPEFTMYVDENGPCFGEEAKGKTPKVTLRMALNTAHQFWLDKLNIPKALALRHITAKGPVQTVLKLLPLLKPGQQMYPEYCKKFGLSME